ncbi:MAG: alpha/beta fold hydrolase [Eggerthellaceae bacterium]|nr:alpha/beta fold hydrolase [Eggerthellaceae bacterium]
MPGEVIKDEFTFTSADGKTPIHVVTWVPAGEWGKHPKGIVQLAHGMVEYIDRYDGFARFLASNGFAVCGNDHIGHGESVVRPEDLSRLPIEGANVMIVDMRTLQKTFAKGFPQDTPYFIFGHSMGSFAARYYVAAFHRSLAGAIFCGTGQVGVTTARLGGGLARLLAKLRGVDYESNFIHGLADGAYAKAIPDARTKFDWINSDPAKVDEYIDDPLCGKMFNLGGYASLLDLTAASCGSMCFRAMPADARILFVSGAEDPVGDRGKGVKKASELVYYHCHAKPDLILYDGMRHEILNEPGREKVYEDILSWLEKALLSVAEKSAVKVRLKPVSERRKIPCSADAGEAAQTGAGTSPDGQDAAALADAHDSSRTEGGVHG